MPLSVVDLRPHSSQNGMPMLALACVVIHLLDRVGLTAALPEPIYTVAPPLRRDPTEPLLLTVSKRGSVGSVAASLTGFGVKPALRVITLRL